MSRAADHLPSPRRSRNRLLAALQRAGREVDAAAALDVEVLDAAGRAEVLAFVEAISSRVRTLRAALRKAEANAAAVLAARAELRAEARARRGDGAL